MIFDDRPCTLGEGPLWHPERGQLFWFDIIGKRLLTRAGDTARDWHFDEHVSAAGWIDRDTLLVASESRLMTLDLGTDRREQLCPLEADNPATRSNDGRADPWGGFWIGTMGKQAEPGAGAIYRFHRGDLRRLFAPLTIPNAICFTPDGGQAYFADTATRVIHRVALDAEGWPKAEPEIFLDLSAEGWRPDGAVTDEAGNLWNAQFGAGRVACYSPDGPLLTAIALPGAQTTCPAFGGPGLGTLYCTSALEGLTEAELAATPDHGRTFAVSGAGRGRAEPRVAP